MLRNFTGSTGIRAAIAVLMLLFVVACSGSDSGIKRERDEARAAAEAEAQARMDAEAAAKKAAEEAAEAARVAAEEAAAQAERDKQAAVAAAEEAARQQVIAQQQMMAVTDAVAAAQAAVAALMDASSDADVTGAMADIAKATAAIAAATSFSAEDTAMYTAQVAAIQANLTLAEANIRAHRAELAAQEAMNQATASARAKQAVDEAIAALTAADQAEAMSTAAYTAAAAALSAAQTAVANADADTLADASAALAAALADAATAAADLGVKTQAVTDATAALEAARTTLASVDPTHVSLQAATAALERAQTEANNQAEAIKALQKQIADLQKAEQDRMDAANRMAEEERMKEMTATGKAIYGALGAAPLGKLDADTDPILTSTSLTLAASTAVTDLTIPPMDAGDPASTLGGWSGMNYVEDDTSTKQSDRALVYTNLSLPKPVAWADSEYGDTAPTFGDTADARAKSSRFPSSIGTRTYSEVGDPQVQLPGTYDGASGLYLCTGACTVTYTSAGPTFSTGWSFNPADNAMVQPADDAYLYFGWWVQTNDGDPTHASAFFGVVGTDGDAATAGAADTLSGTATYGGKAVGKYAINNVLAGNAEGGHFTADATLTAKFTSGADGDTITGTINNFMAGGEAKAWSVSLTEGTIASGGDFGVGGMTEWSIGGNKAAKAGSYSGQLYNATDDSDEVPAQALGSFHAEYSGLGRMVGAFGADKQ